MMEKCMICDDPETQKHHIVPRANCKSNVTVPLCSKHHRPAHGKFTESDLTEIVNHIKLLERYFVNNEHKQFTGYHYSQLESINKIKRTLIKYIEHDYILQILNREI